MKLLFVLFIPILLFSQETLYMNDTLFVDDKYYRTFDSDLDGDGRVDLFREKKIDEFKSKIYFYNNVDNIKGEPDLIFFEDRAGYSNLLYGGVTAGKDINGDGYQDLLITHSLGPYGEGISGFYLYFGSENGIDTEADMFVSSVDNAHGISPYSVGLGLHPHINGDFNGDGYNDIMIVSTGTYWYVVGAIHVFYGGPSLDGIGDFYAGGVVNEHLGQKISVGDLNGDGYDDIIAEADEYNTLFIYKGSPNGLVEDPISLGVDSHYSFSANNDFNGDSKKDLFLEKSDSCIFYFFDIDFNIENEISLSDLGGSVSTPDINGDGINDLAIVKPVTEEIPCVVYTAPFDFEEDPQYIYSNSNTNQLAGNGSYNIGDILGKGYDQIKIGPLEGKYKILVRDKENSSSLEEIPTIVELKSQNYPDPFNPNTTIVYDSRNFDKFNFDVINLKGEIIISKVVYSNNLRKDEIEFNGSSLGSGTYLYTISSLNKNGERKIFRGKMSLIK
ncbi:MAG: hypothetical protein CR982_00620 [Candidatus Cloacimonadota bacterium]|nr:MAG: hypothetical protein CR982_00620 [Candidatus Cloacimonadota bacterium]PIE78434.1 MAG: hypothetical protein CSA15_07795 [Candidatus Delongbacteria bacterium]